MSQGPGPHPIRPGQCSILLHSSRHPGLKSGLRSWGESSPHAVPSCPTPPVLFPDRLTRRKQRRGPQPLQGLGRPTAAPRRGRGHTLRPGEGVVRSGGAEWEDPLFTSRRVNAGRPPDLGLRQVDQGRIATPALLPGGGAVGADNLGAHVAEAEALSSPLAEAPLAARGLGQEGDSRVPKVLPRTGDSAAQTRFPLLGGRGDRGGRLCRVRQAGRAGRRSDCQRKGRPLR